MSIKQKKVNKEEEIQKKRTFKIIITEKYKLQCLLVDSEKKETPIHLEENK